MKNSRGITQDYWETLDEDERFGWKIFTRFLALCAGILISKTGYIVIDIVIAINILLFSSLIIESQRAYNKFTPRNRKNIIKVVIWLGSWSVAFLGIAIFAQIGTIAIQTIVSIMMSMEFENIPNKLLQAIFLISLIIAATVGIIKSFRQNDVEKLIYHAPRDFFIKLFLKKQLQVTSFLQFAYFELMILFATAIYSSMATQTIKVFISML